MKKVLLVLSFLAVAVATQAQVVVIGPNSRVIWSDALTPVTTAQTLTVTPTIDGVVATIFTPITCVVNSTTATTSDCSTPASQIPIGTHTITITNTLGTLVSSPSAAYSYTTLLIPIPTVVHIAHIGPFWNRHYILG